MAKRKGKKGKASKNGANEEALWVAPRYSMKGPAGERVWENRPGGPPSTSRYLELADIALGLRQPARRKQTVDRGTHDVASKTEPYKA